MFSRVTTTGCERSCLQGIATCIVPMFEVTSSTELENLLSTSLRKLKFCSRMSPAHFCSFKFEAFSPSMYSPKYLESILIKTFSIIDSIEISNKLKSKITQLYHKNYSESILLDLLRVIPKALFRNNNYFFTK